jgi:hypothetical protein
LAVTILADDCTLTRGEGRTIGVIGGAVEFKRGARQNLPSGHDEAVRSKYAMTRREEMERCGRWS